MFEISFPKYVRFNFPHEHLGVREGLRANLCKKYTNKPFNSFSKVHTNLTMRKYWKRMYLQEVFFRPVKWEMGLTLAGRRGSLNHTTLYLPKKKNCDWWNNPKEKKQACNTKIISYRNSIMIEKGTGQLNITLIPFRETIFLNKL